MIAIIDYGVGNLFSLSCSFKAVGAECVVTGDAEAIKKADAVVLPGVGAFADAAGKLRSGGLEVVVRQAAESGKPLLGVCLGMQLLFDGSSEYGEHPGLGLIPGWVRPIAEVIPAGLKIPHIGWNALSFPENREKCPIFKYVDPGECVYFVHSYYAADCDESTAALAEYGAPLTAAAWSGNVYGCQFHPEKSGDVGARILRAFCELGG